MLSIYDSSEWTDIKKRSIHALENDRNRKLCHDELVREEIFNYVEFSKKSEYVS